MSRGQQQMEELSTLVWESGFTGASQTDSWCFCDKRGKEFKICWQHTEMQFRANEHKLPVRKYSYVSTGWYSLQALHFYQMWKCNTLCLSLPALPHRNHPLRKADFCKDLYIRSSRFITVKATVLFMRKRRTNSYQRNALLPVAKENEAFLMER